MIISTTLDTIFIFYILLSSYSFILFIKKNKPHKSLKSSLLFHSSLNNTSPSICSILLFISIHFQPTSLLLPISQIINPLLYHLIPINIRKNQQEFSLLHINPLFSFLSLLFLFYTFYSFNINKIEENMKENMKISNPINSTSFHSIHIILTTNKSIINALNV